jgi:GR25 family glycosyltransferase involved in LPS biosynthesis
MIPSKAYIIRISSAISQQYAEGCAKTCEDVGIDYDFFDGVENRRNYDAWMMSGLDIKPGSMDHRKDTWEIDAAACCSVSHALIWKRIVETQQCAIVLEHDALMLHKIDIDIPDNKIVVLGYKLVNPSRYDHIAAGPPKQIIDIPYHHGAHAYAITPGTAAMLLNELKYEGGGGPIDNRFFMKKRWSKIPLAIVDPTPAIGWIRRSTIWENADRSSQSTIRSFSKHLKM